MVRVDSSTLHLYEGKSMDHLVASVTDRIDGARTILNQRRSVLILKNKYNLIYYSYKTKLISLIKRAYKVYEIIQNN